MGTKKREIGSMSRITLMLVVTSALIAQTCLAQNTGSEYAEGGSQSAACSIARTKASNAAAKAGDPRAKTRHESVQQCTCDPPKKDNDGLEHWTCQVSWSVDTKL
jgi:hypothetical protein